MSRPVLASLLLHTAMLGAAVLAGSSDAREAPQPAVTWQPRVARAELEPQPTPPDVVREQLPVEPELTEPEWTPPAIAAEPPIVTAEAPAGTECERERWQRAALIRIARPPVAEPEPRVATEAAEPPAPTPPQPLASQAAAFVPPRPCTSSNEAPIYPRRARRLGLQGEVLLEVLVGADGRVVLVTVQTSSGHDLLDRAAIRALERWVFEPAMRDGRAVEARIPIPVAFELSN
ncbi:MAG: energy transducer TonB [Planctomycetes bacterium]|nr:energy transducer TonB [Planctomycetota bacterium]